MFYVYRLASGSTFSCQSVQVDQIFSLKRTHGFGWPEGERERKGYRKKIKGKKLMIGGSEEVTRNEGLTRPRDPAFCVLASSVGSGVSSAQPGVRNGCQKDVCEDRRASTSG